MGKYHSFDNVLCQANTVDGIMGTINVPFGNVLCQPNTIRITAACFLKLLCNLSLAIET